MDADNSRHIEMREQQAWPTRTVDVSHQKTTPAETQQRVISLVEDRYREINYTYLSELLAERERVRLSRSTLRRILVKTGLASPRRRSPRHRTRRQRMPQEGTMPRGLLPASCIASGKLFGDIRRWSGTSSAAISRTMSQLSGGEFDSATVINSVTWPLI